MKLNSNFFFTLAFLSTFSIPAFGYVDPGSGHLLWQFLLAALMGGAFYFRKAGRYLTSKIAAKNKKKKASQKAAPSELKKVQSQATT